jgi:hypothetical protein
MEYAYPKAVAEYEGQVPGHYFLRQPLQQWKPAIQRDMTFGSQSQPTGIQWPEISGRQLAALSDPRAFFQERIGHDGWNVELMHRGRTSDNQPTFAGVFSVLEVAGSTYPCMALSPCVRGDALDLAVYDPTDPNEVLVIATKYTPGSIHIVRRLYHTDDAF